MSPMLIAWIVFACVFGGALAGILLRRVLPAHHLSPESKDSVKLGAGLIATMAALVLGLLTASAKSSFDTQGNEVKLSASQIVFLDRALAHYGPETKEIRDLIRRAITLRLETTWPEVVSPAGKVAAGKLEDTAQTRSTVDSIEDQLHELAPRDETQRWLQRRALQISGGLVQTRWLLFGQAAGSSIPMPFLVVVVFWLTVLFASFGLLAPPNATVVGVLVLSALSVAGAIFLILEMDRPFDGVLKISSDPLRYALSQIDR